MTELKRLLESSPNAESRQLLRAGLGDRAPARALARARAALGIAAGLGASSTVAAAAAASGAGATAAAGPGTVGLIGLAKLFGVGIAAGTLTAGATGLVQHELARSELPAPVVTSAPLATAPGVVPSAPAVAAIARSGATQPGPDGPNSRQLAVVEPMSKVPARAVVALSPSPDLPVAPPTASIGALPRLTGALAREVESIDRSRAALASGAGERALAELDRYDRERETGVLDREAWLLRIEAALLLGQGRRAAELSRGYLKRFPKDAHEARLRDIAERHGPTGVSPSR